MVAPCLASVFEAIQVLEELVEGGRPGGWGGEVSDAEVWGNARRQHVNICLDGGLGVCQDKVD